MIILGRWVMMGAVIGAMVFPLITEAWFFNVAAAQMPSDDNAQTVDLLSPNVSLASGDYSAVDPDADVQIDSGNSLAPEIGTDGTLADVTGASDSDSGAIQTYVVVHGDTVAKVAAAFKTSDEAIRSANNMSKTDVLHVGDILLIVPSDTATAASTSSNAKNPKSAKTSSGKKSHFIFHGSTAEMGSTALMIHIPVVSTIVRDYFIKPIPCPMTQGKHDLYAVDLSCGAIGTPIKAAADGIVMYAKYGNNGGYGNLVIMKHPNGMLTFYAHIKPDGINVHQGQSVSQGTIIAYVGDTGHSTGPHLHFEVRGGGNPGFDYSGSAWKK